MEPGLTPVQVRREWLLYWENVRQVLAEELDLNPILHMLWKSKALLRFLGTPAMSLLVIAFDSWLLLQDSCLSSTWFQPKWEL